MSRDCAVTNGGGPNTPAVALGNHGINDSALRIRSQNRPRPRGFTLGANGWSAVDRTIRECGMRSAECGMLSADRGDWAMQTGPFIICAGGMLQHDKQATSHCLWQLGIPHCAFRIPHSAFVPRTGLDLAASRSEQTDGRPWIERLGNAECGVRNAECCLQIEATGRCRRDRSLCARAGCSNTTSRRLHTAFGSSEFRIAHSAFRTPHSFPEQASTSRLHARSKRMVGRGSND